MSDKPNEWIACKNQAPPKNVVVETKIDDESGARNIQLLKLNGWLWFVSDGSTYVYYEPTHWRPL